MAAKLNFVNIMVYLWIFLPIYFDIKNYIWYHLGNYRVYLCF